VAHNSHEYTIVYGAAAKIGAIVLPVNYRFQTEEVECVLKDGLPRLVSAGPDFQPTVGALAGKIESIEACYAIGGEATVDGFRRFEDLYGDAGSDQQSDVSGDSGFVIIHTAAVAGRPRGALLSQHHITAINMGMILQFGLNSQDCHISHLPLFHIAGLSVSTAVMHAGGANVICGTFDPETTLRLIEEEKELIKPGGENVYPAEVEKVILTHEAIKEVCVIGVPDPKWGEAIKAVCSLEAGKALPDAELIEYVASRIARYKKPQQVVFVDALPKTAEREIDREQVKKDHGGKY
jgi:acyl-CoA synthetase (AMP-forming)/AMP-acid ligase II